MLRTIDGNMWGTDSDFASYNPIVPIGNLAITIDTYTVKVGDGVNNYNILPYIGSNSIGNKILIGTPTNNEIIRYDNSQDAFIYSLQGIVDSATNFESTNDTYPTFSLLIETDSLGTLTGRAKISDGSTPATLIPWLGFYIDDFPTGYSLESNGYEFIPASYVSQNIFPTNPTGTDVLVDTASFVPLSSIGVLKAASSIDNHVVIFDGTSGGDIQDSGVAITDIMLVDSTPSNSFQIGNGGPILYNSSGILKIYNSDGVTLGNEKLYEIYASYGNFATIYVGYPTETTSVDLTSDGTYLYVDGGKLIDTNHDGHGCGFDADTLDTYHASYFASTGHTQFASTVNFATGGVLSTTYKTLQNYMDIQPAGRIDGGILTAGSGIVSVSAGYGLLKKSSDCIADTIFVNWPAQNVTLYDGYTNYVYIDYNAGTPTAFATTNRSSINLDSQVTLGRAFRNGTTVSAIQSGTNAYCGITRTHERFIATDGYGMSHASGGAISATGTRNIASTSGTFYIGLNKITTTAKDTSGSDTFTYWYRNGSGGWTSVASQTTINNTQYDDGTGTLATLSNNQYGVHFVYISFDGSLQVLYGQDSYTLTEANNASIPSSLPAMLSSFSDPAAKIIIVKSGTSFTSITSAYTTPFPISSPSDHNDLGGLQGGTTDQYYHLTSAEYTTTVPRYWGELASAPATYKAGDSYYNTGDTTIKMYISSVGWITIS